MKKTFTLLLVFFYITNGFSQTSSRVLLSKKKTLLSDGFFYKNQHFIDVDTSDNDEGSLVNMKDSTVSKRAMKSIWGNLMGQYANTIYTIDSIPETASINVNGVIFNSRKVLSKVSNYTILNVKKDSLYTFSRITSDSLKKFEYTDVRVKYQRPKGIVYQAHPNLPYNFFVFKLNTLEPIRYTSSSYSPVLDVFNTEDSIGFNPKPRVMIDGRLQAKTFDYQNLDLKNTEKIEVFGGIDAKIYFGGKAKAGLISIITKGSTFNLDWVLSTTRVVGEMQDKKGNWKVISDTLFSTIDDFKKYHKKCLESNGAIYKIDGEFETENVNRKTIDMDGINNVKIVTGTRTKDAPFFSYSKGLGIRNETKVGASDTIFIETKRSRLNASANSNFGRVISDLQRLRKTSQDIEPLYFVDNQEIDSEKLKLYKPKELEFVESLEGCDAISKYGKRAEFGVVIYRKKKVE
jgi:hypothetical protein